VFENEGAAAAASGLDSAHEARCACSENEDVYFSHMSIVS
jgi:hypothetical protein